MKKHILVFLMSMMAFLFPIDTVKAQEVVTDSVVLGVEQEMMAEKKMLHNPNFRFGETVIISEDLSGDTYVAGGIVRIEGTIDGDLLVAGGDVTINGDVTQDLRVLGGTIKLNGTVEQNLSVVGGEVFFGPYSKVNGSLVGGGGNSDLNGSIMGGTWFGSGNMTLAGDHGDQVNLWVGSAQLLPSANIEGDLNVQMDSQGVLNDKDANITGKKNVQVIEPDQKMVRDQQKMESAVGAFNLGAKLVGLLMALVAGSVFLYLLPKLMTDLSASIAKDPIGSIGWGFVRLVMMPIAIILLMVTVIGLPLGFLILLSYLASLVVANWIGALAVGEFVYKKYKFTWMKGSYRQYAVGLILVALVGIIPVFGGLTKFVLFLMGMGAIMNWCKTIVKK